MTNINLKRNYHETLIKNCNICSRQNSLCDSCNEQKWVPFNKKLNAGIPLVYCKKTWDDVSQSVLYDKQVQQYRANIKTNFEEGNGLVLWSYKSQTGTGKTMVACLILEDALKLGYSIHYVTLTDLREAVYGHTPQHKTNQRRYEEADVLLIDEVTDPDTAMGKLGDGERNALYTILKARDKTMKPSIITSTVSPDQWLKKLGEPIHSLGNRFMHIECTLKDKADFRKTQSASNLTGLPFIGDVKQKTSLSKMYGGSDE